MEEGRKSISEEGAFHLGACEDNGKRDWEEHSVTGVGTQGQH